MALFDRFKSRRNSAPAPGAASTSSSDSLTSVSAHLYTGDEALEIVGEANYQEALWTICGGAVGERIRHRIIAALVPEPQNPYDGNAISIQIDGRLVGYLARDVARPCSKSGWDAE